MSKPYDATLNSLIDEYLPDWGGYLAARVGLPMGVVHALDTDLSATVQADRLFRLDGPTQAVLHLEMESSGHLGIPEELLRYNVMARHATQLPVHSVVMLLRPKATATDLTGLLELPDSLGQTYLTFRYTVIRLWQEPFDGLLNAGVGIAPLALLTNEAAVDLAVAGVRFRQWVQKSNLPNHIARQLLGTAGILCGLRYNADEVLEVTMGGRNILDDSSVAQEFMRRGRAEALQNTLIVLGSDLFGQPTQELKARIQAIPDVARLERMTRKIITLKTWDELTTIQ